MCVSKTLLVAGGVALFELVVNSAAADDYRSNRIRIEYVVPKNPQHQPIYDTLQKQKALEKLQEIFAAFQLPIDLTLRTTGCGFTNAWYQEDVITVCYEYLDHINKNAPKEVTEAGLTPDDAIAGQFFYAFAHEMGHAAFDLLSVPNFGGQEDAADRFGAYVILHLGPEDAKRLIMGAAYGYRPFMEHPTVNVPLKVFSDGHNPPPERYYNLLCIAYGAHPELFAEVVTKNLLPEQRAARCRREYGEVNYAFQKTVSPHVDQEIAKRVMQREWLPEVKTTHRSK